MKNYKTLNIRGTVLDKHQLETYLEKIAVKTGKIAYSLQNVSQLPALFQTIYSEATGNNVNSIDTFINNEKYQNDIEMVNGFADQSAIIIYTQKCCNRL